jgi:DNA-binding PadR family transcriptional regulator
MAAKLTGPDLALHALHVSGWLTRERLAGWGVDEPDEVLANLSGAGLVRVAQSPRGGLFSLTDEGKARAQAWAGTWLADLPAADRAALPALIDSFEDIDPQLKRVVSACQERGAQAGSAALTALHEEARETITMIAAIGPHWVSYPGRLDHAVSQVGRGHAEYLASPLLDSYHTVWHLLHRDLRMTRTGNE